MRACLFHIYGPVAIYSYGVMIAIGFLVFAYLLFNHPVRKKWVTDVVFFNGIFTGLLAGIIGGRLLFVLSTWEAFADNPLEVFLPWNGGFAVLGAFATTLIVIPLYLRWHRIPMLPLLDVTAMYAPLMQAIARFGCLFAGCCYGIPAPKWLWWAVTFTDPEGYAPLGIILHPTQLYLSLSSFIIFLILYYRFPQRSRTPGRVLFLFLALESISRFANDFLRGDRDLLITHFDTFGIPLTFSLHQWISLGMLGIGLAGLIGIRMIKRDKI